MYDKKVAYLHYMKENALMGNAGHVKVMVRGNSMSLEIYVRDMQMVLSGYYSLNGLGENCFTDKIHIEKGQAVYKKRITVDKTTEKQLPHGIRIDLNDSEYLEAIWRAEKVQKVETKAAEQISLPETEKEEEKENIEINQQKEMLTFSVPAEHYENKWQELCKRYDVVHPFGNEEEYISIKPGDFIIFPEKYQNLVNNSFLLHGYYNYQHIILGKKEESGKNIYYLGVPGVYYEREKMVAIMFGFEGFECGDKRASNGGFGYYMRRVEL